MSGPSLSGLEQSFVERFLVRNKSSLVVNFLLILDQSLSSDLCFFFFNLFDDEILESKSSPFLIELKDVIKGVPAIIQSSLGDFRLTEALELNPKCFKVEPSCVKDVVDFIVEVFNPFL
jgi:hypothetical protein